MLTRIVTYPTSGGVRAYEFNGAHITKLVLDDYGEEVHSSKEIRSLTLPDWYDPAHAQIMRLKDQLEDLLETLSEPTDHLAEKQGALVGV